jgi:hypothetical protein
VTTSAAWIAAVSDTVADSNAAISLDVGALRTKVIALMAISSSNLH